MPRYFHFVCAATFAVLFLVPNTTAQIQDYSLKKLFVPQLSQFTQQHVGVVQSFDLSPDGKTIAVEFGTQEPDKTNGSWVALWDVDSAQMIGTKQIDSDIPNIVWYRHKIRFSPDGNMLVAITGPRLVALSFPGLKALYAFEERVQPQSAQYQMLIEGFSMAANRLAILKQYDHNSGHSPSLEVKIADLRSGNVLSLWSKRGLSESIALSSDARLLALTINPGSLKDVPADDVNIFIVRTSNGEVVRAFGSGCAAGNAEFLNDDSTLLITPTYNRLDRRDAVRLWDVKTGQLRQQFTDREYGLRGGVSVSADGGLLAMATFWLNPSEVKLDRNNPQGGSRLMLWTLANGKLVYTSEKLGQQYDFGGLPMNLSWGGAWPGEPPVSVRLSAAGNRLAFGGNLISVDTISQNGESLK